MARLDGKAFRRGEATPGSSHVIRGFLAVPFVGAVIFLAIPYFELVRILRSNGKKRTVFCG